ncbi:MAG: diaminopimelate epimerase [Pseudomonadota bacterium]
MKFYKYHALGNDYLVLDPADQHLELTGSQITRICDRHYGVGADGILFGPEHSVDCDYALRIFNPDSSEAEKSGNGLRIFSRYLWDRSLVSGERFSIETKGGVVHAQVARDGLSVTVGMGKIYFSHDRSESGSTVKAEVITVDGVDFTYYRASVGNPHCVIFHDRENVSYAKSYGAEIEKSPGFANGTNVQFVRVLDRNTIDIDIWERGAGYTFASGSSSTAAAGVAHALGYCDANIDVRMPGGVINISIDDQFNATMTGDVRKVCEGTIAAEAFY